MGREEKPLLKRRYRRKILKDQLKKRKIIQSDNPVMTDEQLQRCLEYYKEVPKKIRAKFNRLFANNKMDVNESLVVDDSVHEYIIGEEKISVIVKKHNVSFPKLYEYIRLVRDIADNVNDIDVRLVSTHDDCK